MTDYRLKSNSNTHGVFETSKRTDLLICEAHRAGADFLGAAPDEVIFGYNMTTLKFHLSLSLAKEISKGEEIILTRLDHDANISSWLILAEDKGARIVWVDINPDDCTLGIENIKKKISERTKLIAFCYASNSTGTINDVKKIVKWAKEVEALPYVDAVQYAPHGFIDVKKLIVTSSSVAPINFLDHILLILYRKREHLDRLRAYKVTPEKDYPSFKWETGTQKP